MSTHIDCWAERRNEKGEWERIETLHPFTGWQSYGMYGFLADCRNYSKVPPISAPRGAPEDADAPVDLLYVARVSALDSYGCRASWLTVGELLAFDYDREFEDRRVMRQLSSGIFSGAEICEPGEGRRTTFRDFLGERFFDDLKRLQEAEAERVIFYFES